MSSFQPNFKSAARLLALGMILWIQSAVVVLASSAYYVDYLPSLKPVEGLLPIDYSYDLYIASPANLPAGTYPISFRVQVNGVLPDGVSEATALSYVSFNPAQPVFNVTAVGQVDVKKVTVRVQIPVNAVPGSYQYQVYTQGWPSGYIFDDGGTAINATATRADTPPPPTVNIDAPADGTVYSVTASSLPKLVDVNISAGATVVAPLTSVVAEVNGVALDLALSGINTASAAGTATLSLAQPGTYTISAKSFNIVGNAEDVNKFTLNVTAPPPTVKINTPTPGSTFTYRAGDPATVVPFTFTAKSNYGGIRTLTAKVDGASVTFTPGGIGTLTATGSINLPYTTAGSHTLQVTTTDDYGTATDNSNFTVTVIAPNPAIVINTPANNAVFDLLSGATTMNIPFTFTTTSNNGFNVDSVSATLDGNPQAITNTAGLGTPSATSTGTMLNVAAGTHTLAAVGTSAGIMVSTSISFTVRAVSVVQPTVVINAPPPGSTYSRVFNGPALSIPMTFTGTSHQPGGTIIELTAKLDGAPLTVTPTNLNTKVADGSATMVVSAAGTHTITVTAKDQYGIASATRTFTVTITQGRTICGEVFFDVDSDGHRDCAEFGLGGVTVKLLNSSSAVVATDVSDCSGDYSFTNLAPGTYTVQAVTPTGLNATTAITRNVTISGSNVSGIDFGFALNVNSLRGMKASGYTIGFWKNNINKALAGKTGGTQVSKSTLIAYTDKIGDFGLSPYDNISMKCASSTMNYNGSNPVSLLSKQLIASEYNYQNRAYLNGNKSLTMLFVWWGEYILADATAHPRKYSSTYLISVKDWFDAYNNTHGGALVGP